MTDTTKFFFLTPIKIGFISSFLSIVSVGVLSCLEEGGSSHEIDEDNMLIFLIVIISHFLLLLSALVLSNYSKTIRKNLVLSFLSFYLPTISFAVFLLVIGFFEKPLLVLFLILPFSILLTYYFVVFRNKLKSDEFEDGFYSIDNE